MWANRKCTVFFPHAERTLSPAPGPLTARGQPPEGPLSPLPVKVAPGSHYPSCWQPSFVRPAFVLYISKSYARFSLGLKPTALLGSERPEWPFLPLAPGGREQNRLEGTSPALQAMWVSRQGLGGTHRMGDRRDRDFLKRHSILFPCVA